MSDDYETSYAVSFCVNTPSVIAISTSCTRFSKCVFAELHCNVSADTVSASTRFYLHLAHRCWSPFADRDTQNRNVTLRLGQVRLRSPFDFERECTFYCFTFNINFITLLLLSMFLTNLLIFDVMYIEKINYFIALKNFNCILIVLQVSIY